MPNNILTTTKNRETCTVHICTCAFIYDWKMKIGKDMLEGTTYYHKR